MERCHRFERGGGGARERATYHTYLCPPDGKVKHWDGPVVGVLPRLDRRRLATQPALPLLAVVVVPEGGGAARRRHCGRPGPGEERTEVALEEDVDEDEVEVEVVGGEQAVQDGGGAGAGGRRGPGGLFVVLSCCFCWCGVREGDEGDEELVVVVVVVEGEEGGLSGGAGENVEDLEAVGACFAAVPRDVFVFGGFCRIQLKNKIKT